MTANKASINKTEKLFLDCFRPLTVFAMQFVRDKDIAKDIVQDLFLYVYEKFDQGEAELPANYLYTLVRYRCLNHLAHQKIREERYYEIEKTYSNPHNPLEMVELIELEHSYLQAIESLPVKCRLVFKMSRNDKKSNQEISEELELSKRTVEAHISHALKAIREKLSDHLAPGMLFLIYMEEIFKYDTLINCL